MSPSTLELTATSYLNPSSVGSTCFVSHFHGIRVIRKGSFRVMTHFAHSLGAVARFPVISAGLLSD